MSVSKSSVSALQEYCAKNKLPAPTYEYIDSGDGSFICACKMETLDLTEHGSGRSKRDAKHQAAAETVKKLRLDHAANINEIPQMSSVEESPTTDMIVKLRDYCVLHNHPLPNIEIVQQAGTPDTPEFTAICQIASLRRFGVSEKKKDAKQKAAQAMLRAIQPLVSRLESEVVSLDDMMEEVEENRYKKFKTYRELTESKTGEMPGVRLRERHNFFTKFHADLKKAANDVINTEYESVETQAFDLFAALKLKPRVQKFPGVKSAEHIVMIDFDCEFDVVIADLESKVYEEAIDYFKIMMV